MQLSLWKHSSPVRRKSGRGDLDRRRWEGYIPITSLHCIVEGLIHVLRRNLCNALLYGLLAMAFVPTAYAEATKAESKSDSVASSVDKASAIRVVQQRPVLKSSRFELQLLGELSVADIMFKHYAAGANAYYHVDEQWAVGASYRQFFSEESGLLKDVTDKFEVFPERAVMRWYAGAEAAWTPIYGKMAFFDDAIVHFDMHFLMGAGVTQTSRSASPRVSGVIGFGGRMLINTWFSILMEVRDQIYVENYNEGDQLVNNIGLSVGFSIFFPFDHDYRFPK
jgi:outer membrane beta-barrel protein